MVMHCRGVSSSLPTPLTKRTSSAVRPLLCVRRAPQKWWQWQLTGTGSCIDLRLEGALLVLSLVNYFPLISVNECAMVVLFLPIDLTTHQYLRGYFFRRTVRSQIL